LPPAPSPRVRFPPSDTLHDAAERSST
jgi:hypothetical protein